MARLRSSLVYFLMVLAPIAADFGRRWGP